jgi:hypothetical protein
VQHFVGVARSTQHLLKIVDELHDRGAGLRILDFGGAEVDTQSPSGKLTLTMCPIAIRIKRCCYQIMSSYSVLDRAPVATLRSEV